MSSHHIPVLNRRLASVLRSTVRELNLSAGAYTRILIVARRIAHWARAPKIGTSHLLTAIQICTSHRRRPTTGQAADAELARLSGLFTHS